MPRIHDRFLKCVVYLYEDEADADIGNPVGATGFLVSVRSEKVGLPPHTYVVTCNHTLTHMKETHKDPHIRMNLTPARAEIEGKKAQSRELPFDWWEEAANGADLAVCPIRFDPDDYDMGFVRHYHEKDEFMTEFLLDQYNIGPGSDTFMVGRFVLVDGKELNTPTARFGNIAMMPTPGEEIGAEITFPDGTEIRVEDQESFLVETHSRPGYSGSPVFVYIPRGTQLDGLGGHRASGAGMDYGPWLLGIDWCHIPDKIEIKMRDERQKLTKKEVPFITGMMGVIPVWHLEELLTSDRQQMVRHEVDRKRQGKKIAEPQHGGEADYATPGEVESVELTEEEFSDVLNELRDFQE